MADEQIRDYVLQRADDDDDLSEQARLVVLAAFGDPDDLAEVLSDDATPQKVIDALNAPETAGEVPVGAYLTSIAVQGFRGIGANVVVDLQPGPGLVVVAGRNGSGKSTLAEGLELALTGVNSRWASKGKVWSQVWRNLHAGEPARIRIGMAEQGSGSTVVGVDWPSGDVPVTDLKRWVQRAGKKQEDPGVLGWSNALAMHRPMLSYDELGGILEGTQSEFYDQLYKLLGLEQLTVAIARLDGEVKALKEPAVVAKKSRGALRPTLEAHDDPRAATALALISKSKPDLAAVAPLITESAAATAPSAWRQAAALTTPDGDEAGQAAEALRSAAAEQADAERTAGALAADRVQFLETSLEFHARHGTQPCPVCAQGTLDDAMGGAGTRRAGRRAGGRRLAAGGAVGDPPRAADARHAGARGHRSARRGCRAHVHCRGAGRVRVVLGAAAGRATSPSPITSSRPCPNCARRTTRCGRRQPGSSTSATTPGIRWPSSWRPGSSTPRAARQPRRS